MSLVPIQLGSLGYCVVFLSKAQLPPDMNEKLLTGVLKFNTNQKV